MIAIKSNISEKIKSLTNYVKMISKSFDKNVVFSLGENCLSDNLLERNGLKSFSSPYSSGRSNIEYILAFEKDKFSDFLNLKYLEYEYFFDKKVPRNKKYVTVQNQYHNSCLNGFEFTHHDVISSQKIRNKINKRCQRMLRLQEKNIIMLYHHRLCSETDEELLISHLLELADIYKLRNNDVHIYTFSQVIVSEENQRKAECKIIRGVNVYKFYTLNEWVGNNNNIFWAKCDDDLLKEMITDIKQNLL